MTERDTKGRFVKGSIGSECFKKVILQRDNNG